MTARVRRALAILAAALALLVARPVVAAAPADPGRTILVMLRMAPDHFRPDAGYGGGYADTAGRTALGRVAGRIARQHGLRLVTDWPMPILGISCFVMAVPEGRAPDAIAAEVSRDPAVSWAQPVNVYHVQGAPPAADPLQPAQPANRLWRLDDLHRASTGKGMTVAVIDSRIDVAHPDLAGQFRVARDFVEDGSVRPEDHGTEVAGIIAAKAGNGIGIAGIAPGARLLALRACREAGTSATCDSLSLAKALQFAIEQRADIINLSLSGPPDILLSRLLAIGLDRGATVVAAYDRDRPDGGFPASQPGVLKVSDRPVAGALPTVYAAPGQDVPTTAPGGRWTLVDGSSFSAAHVSGLMALVGKDGRSGRARSATPLRLVGGWVDACGTLHCGLPGRGSACDTACGVAAASR